MLINLLVILLVVLGILLILLVLVQRGKGGGLAGALGGMGGQSAFGARAGEKVTWVTLGLAAAWVLIAIFSVLAIASEAGRRAFAAPVYTAESATAAEDIVEMLDGNGILAISVERSIEGFAARWEVRVRPEDEQDALGIIQEFEAQLREEQQEAAGEEGGPVGLPEGVELPEGLEVPEGAGLPGADGAEGQAPRDTAQDQPTDDSETRDDSEPTEPTNAAPPADDGN